MELDTSHPARRASVGSKNSAENAPSRLPKIVAQFEADILADWIDAQLDKVWRKEALKETELREQSKNFLFALREAITERLAGERIARQ